MGNKLQVHRYMCTGVIYFISTKIQFEQKTWYVTIRFFKIYNIVLRVELLLVSDEENPSYWTTYRDYKATRSRNCTASL